MSNDIRVLTGQKKPFAKSLYSSKFLLLLISYQASKLPAL